ncbi:MAG: gamma carbonic anhydrase family protein [Pseudomonadota bacterium]
MIYALDGVAPKIAADAWVAPDANIIGNVVIEAGASIWFGATLRGDNEPIVVGPGSNVQELVVMHTDPGFPLVIGANCTIGHKALLHGCRVADGSLVGMAATILNGAQIGAGCLIGAAALVTEGKVIDPGSLVMGAPGKVVRALDANARADLLASAEHYQARARHFATTLTPIET